MRVAHLVLASLSALSASAQRSGIRLPTVGQNIKAGKHFVVQVVRPNSIEGSTEVGMVIGLAQCSVPASCPSPGSILGTILFNGDFKPQLHEIPATPYENFSVVAPAGFPAGPAQLTTVRLHLIGAGPAPVLEANNVTINVV